MKKQVGDPCPYCKRKLTREVMQAKAKAKSDNAYATIEKKRINGTKGGRTKKRDDEIIKALRTRGLSMRAIAKIVGFSTATVQKGLKS